VPLTCNIRKWAIQASGPPSNVARLSSNKADIQLALFFVNFNKIRRVRKADSVFGVPKTTLCRQRAGKPSRLSCVPNSKKLTKLEQESDYSALLDQDSRGFAPTYDAMRDRANKLPGARG
jgi:hypothetical protein